MGTQQELVPSSTLAKHLELVDKIIQKTRERKIRWVRVASGFTALIPPNLRIVFERDASPLDLGWRKFEVHQGEKLVFESVLNSNLLMAALMGASALNKKISELYNLVLEGQFAEIDRAIGLLDSI